MTIEQRRFASHPREFFAWVPRWLGIPTVQHPADMMVMQEIITEVRPDFIIETGTFMGGSALFFATVLDQVHPTGTVLTVDINDIHDYKDISAIDIERLRAYREHVEFILGDSTSAGVIRHITDRVRGHRVMVTLDSDHEATHVLREMEAYGPLVSVGSYLVVQDTFIERAWGVKEPPIVAVRKFLRSHPEYEIDRSRERFGATWYSEGYLRRVR